MSIKYLYVERRRGRAKEWDVPACGIKIKYYFFLAKLIIECIPL